MWKIWTNPDKKGTSTDIGVSLDYHTGKNVGHFFHNVNANDGSLNGTWNMSHSNNTPHSQLPKDSQGKSLWYTFTQADIEKTLDNYPEAAKREAKKRKEEVKAARKEKRERLTIAGAEKALKQIAGNNQSDVGSGGRFWIELGIRGPRTDHGGGDDGEGWMSSRQIEKVSKPYFKQAKPKMDRIKQQLKDLGYRVKDLRLDYGEKGHISVDGQITNLKKSE
jgi:hypothetical protein